MVQVPGEAIVTVMPTTVQTPAVSVRPSQLNGVVVLLPSSAGVAKIGRMAVSRPLRGSQLGRDILLLLVDIAALRGDREVCLHAQCSAEGFYARLGFARRGEVFDELGVAHVEMFKSLSSVNVTSPTSPTSIV